MWKSPDLFYMNDELPTKEYFFKSWRIFVKAKSKSLLAKVESRNQGIYMQRNEHHWLKFSHGHMVMQKSVVGIKQYWVQPVYLPVRGTIYEKRELIGIALLWFAQTAPVNKTMFKDTAQ